MKKSGLSNEILCLILIITVVSLFGKVLLDIRGVFEGNGNSINGYNHVEFKPYSHRENSRIEKIKDLTVIRNEDDLKYFTKLLDEVNINIKWLDNKLEDHDEKYFEENTLVVISLVNDDNVAWIRIDNVKRKNDELIIGLNKKINDRDPSSKYTWFAVIEVNDVDSDVVLDIKEI